MQKIKGLSEIETHYDILFCDIWGVLHNGHDVFYSAFEALKSFKQNCQGYVALISNSPRPCHKVKEQINDILGRSGFSESKALEPSLCYDLIITSGDASYNELKRLAPGPAFKLGPERDDPLYEELDLQFSEIEEARFISCTGLFDEENEEVDAYRSLLMKACQRELPLVCVNPDLYIQKGDRIIPCSGALARLYQDIGGKVIYAGKPHPPIYHQLIDQIQLTGFQRGQCLDKKRILAIGDSLRTDIAGANQQGIDSLYIMHGLLAKQEMLLEKGEQNHQMDVSLNQLEETLRVKNLTVNYILQSLIW